MNTLIESLKSAFHSLLFTFEIAFENPFWTVVSNYSAYCMNNFYKIVPAIHSDISKIIQSFNESVPVCSFLAIICPFIARLPQYSVRRYYVNHQSQGVRGHNNHAGYTRLLFEWTFKPKKIIKNRIDLHSFNASLSSCSEAIENLFVFTDEKNGINTVVRKSQGHKKVTIHDCNQQ